MSDLSSRSWGFALAFMLFACADQADSIESSGSYGPSDDDDDDAPETSSSGITPLECYEMQLGTRGDVCSGYECTGVTTCVEQFDCITCSSQCLPPACSTDAECQSQFGDVCPGVNWVCSQYLLGTYCEVDLGGGGGSSGDPTGVDPSGSYTTGVDPSGDSSTSWGSTSGYDSSTSYGDSSSGWYGSGSDGGSTSGGGGCDRGEVTMCVGDSLLECANDVLHDCQQACVDGGYSGAADPPCGLGDMGYDVCFCV
jgi:hypothetical protein